MYDNRHDSGEPHAVIHEKTMPELMEEYVMTEMQVERTIWMT